MLFQTFSDSDFAKLALLQLVFIWWENVLIFSTLPIFFHIKYGLKNNSWIRTFTFFLDIPRRKKGGKLPGAKENGIQSTTAVSNNSPNVEAKTMSSKMKGIIIGSAISIFFFLLFVVVIIIKNPRRYFEFFNFRHQIYNIFKSFLSYLWNIDKYIWPIFTVNIL